MRRFFVLISLVAATFLAACADTETPVLGTPVAVEILAAADVAGPRLSSGPDGQLILSWMERGESGTTLRYSPLVHGKFSPAVDVIVEPRMFVNWADLPSVTSLGDQTLIAHWLRYSAEKTYSYDVVVSQSFDDGKTWGKAMTAHTDGTPTEHGFVSMVPGDDGAALLWLDGRNTPGASMSLRSAVITPDGRRVREQEVDGSVCDCCQTDIAMTASGPVAVYRDRTSEEIRDIYVTRYVDGRWEPGTRLYADDWNIAGCPVNGPSIVARDMEVAVAWFAAANDRPVVRVIRSSDGGATFGTPVEIASGRSNGYVGLALLDDEAVAVSWVEKNDDGSNGLRLRRVAPGGRAGPVLEIGRTNQLRVVPQLAFFGGDLYLVWTDEKEEVRELKSVRVPVRASRRNRSS